LEVTSGVDGHGGYPRFGWRMRHDGNWLVTTFLQPGEHTFTVRVIGTQGQTATDAV
jgi:hypothetical protein